MCIFYTHYHTSFLTLIFSVASVTLYKLTYLVCPMQGLQGIKKKSITLKLLFKQVVFNNFHKN